MISFQAQNSWRELLLNQLHTFILMILFSFSLSRFLTLEVNFKQVTSQFAAVMGISFFLKTSYLCFKYIMTSYSVSNT